LTKKIDSVIELVNWVILEAIKAEATDIHNENHDGR
jgi:type II secretory ATPase GspE/PulE/Tfp pilus assembly ATPase PilB-like protein